MKKNKIRFCSFLICLILITLLCPITSLAMARVDVLAKCSLQVAFTPEDIKATDVEFKIYRVASVLPSLEFEAEEPFKGQSVMELLNDPDAEKYSLIASTLSGVIASDQSIKPYATAITNSEGIATYKDIQTGLYLVIGEGYQENGMLYTPLKYLVLLPEKQEHDVLSYDVFSNVKWEKCTALEYKDLKVLKVWSDSAKNLHRNDNVTVELYKGNKLYDTQTLNKANNWSYTCKKLNAADEWSVKEQSVKGYTATVELDGDCFIITNTPTGSSGEDPDKKLPQSGLLWWPVPVLIAAGILCIMIGMYAKRKGSQR